MPLESADYVSQLVITNPDGEDKRYTSDDHHRLIKKAIKQSFPNVNGPVYLTPTQFSYLRDLTSTAQAQIQELGQDLRELSALVAASVDTDLTQISADLNALETRVGSLSAQVSSLDLSAPESTLNRLSASLDAVTTQLGDLFDRARYEGESQGDVEDKSANALTRAVARLAAANYKSIVNVGSAALYAEDMGVIRVSMETTSCGITMADFPEGGRFDLHRDDRAPARTVTLTAPTGMTFRSTGTNTLNVYIGDRIELFKDGAVLEDIRTERVGSQIRNTRQSPATISNTTVLSFDNYLANTRGEYKTASERYVFKEDGLYMVTARLVTDSRHGSAGFSTSIHWEYPENQTSWVLGDQLITQEGTSDFAVGGTALIAMSASVTARLVVYTTSLYPTQGGSAGAEVCYVNIAKIRDL